MNVLRVSVFLTLLAGTSAAATGADSTCDATLNSHLLSGGTDCAASSGVCPSSCLAALTALDVDCAGKKYTYSETKNGKDVEAALDWNTDKARYLILYQVTANLGLSGSSDDACNEVIHDYQLTHINDCNEAFYNAAVDVLHGYYCESPQSDANTCHVNCQETIDKLESVCNPAGGPLGKFYTDDNKDTDTTADDVYTEHTYSSVWMGGVNTLGPKACSYKTTAPSASSASSLGSLSFVASLLAAMVLATF